MNSYVPKGDKGPILASQNEPLSTSLFYVYICMLGNVLCFCSHLLTFFKIKISKNSFRNTIRVSNGLDPDQDRPYVSR